MYEMNGRPTSGTTGLGIVEVSGRSRVPSPPARISACIPLPTDALVHESGRLDGLRIDEVSAVDHHGADHPLRHRAPVELPELRPFRDEDAGVRARDGVERRVGEVDPDHHLPGLLL